MTQAASPEVFRQLGQITRQLHDTLVEMGVMRHLQHAAAGLPDARHRLDYVSEKTGEAAVKVLDLVDLAQCDRARMAEATQRLATAAGAASSLDELAAEAVAVAAVLESTGERIDAQLLAIMMAQDFHDLTSQVVAKVLQLAQEVEDSLVELLLQTAPEQANADEVRTLEGPVVSRGSRPDVVADQREVDDLLADLGF